MGTKKSIYLISTLLTAAILWYLTFIVKPMNFWLEMSISILILVSLAYFQKRDLFSTIKITRRHIIVGIISAIGLYLVFYVGNIIAGYLFSFKDAQISMIYGNKAQGSLAMIGVLLLFIIGPGEVLYWQGYVQTTLTKKFGDNLGYIISVLLYAAVHIATGNFMVILAALVCGFYWGWIYKKEKSLVPIIISHAIWDVTIFVLLPVK
jgi:uncharacterized protein